MGQQEAIKKKYGVVLIVGRPNVGKSTFLNNLIGQKVAITSPKPQTTRLPIRALYQEERGTVIFVDTPGIFGTPRDPLSKKINQATGQAINEEIDVVLYMVDHSRRRDFEEAKVLGTVRKIDKPKILVINKIDIKEPTYLAHYKFLEEEFTDIYKISALNKNLFRPLLEKIFEYLPEREVPSDIPTTPYPLLNMDSKTFIAELIREKIFLKTRKEVPYASSVIVDEITERKNKTMYIKARILTTDSRYKKMLVGRGGAHIKEMGSMARREIELAINKKVYLDLEVETDPHWQEIYYS